MCWCFIHFIVKWLNWFLSWLMYIWLLFTNDQGGGMAPTSGLFRYSPLTPAYPRDGVKSDVSHLSRRHLDRYWWDAAPAALLLRRTPARVSLLSLFAGLELCCRTFRNICEWVGQRWHQSPGTGRWVSFNDSFYWENKRGWIFAWTRIENWSTKL